MGYFLKEISLAHNFLREFEFWNKKVLSTACINGDERVQLKEEIYDF
jgi:hypothetical protein